MRNIFYLRGRKQQFEIENCTLRSSSMCANQIKLGSPYQCGICNSIYFSGKAEGNRPLWRYWRGCGNNIKMDVKEIRMSTEFDLVHDTT